jgi:predicted DsbA family dithiol-disulfide isomerase
VRIEQLRKNYNIAVRWAAFPLHPETPEEGRSLEELFAGRSVNVAQMMQRLKKVAKDLGLPLGERKKTYNSRLAQELAKWAESREKGDQYHAAVFNAYFVDGINIGKIEELVKLAGSIGLTKDQAREVLVSRSFKQAVYEDWTRSRTLGINAVPTFVVNNANIVGAQSYEVLEQFLIKAGAQKRK